jgi:hypothetical protein
VTQVHKAIDLGHVTRGRDVFSPVKDDESLRYPIHLKLPAHSAADAAP